MKKVKLFVQLLLTAVLCCPQLYAQKDIIITGSHISSNSHDTVFLLINRELFFNKGILVDDSVLVAPLKQSRFRLAVEQANTPAYLTLQTSGYKSASLSGLHNRILFSQYPFLPGDSIDIGYNDTKVYFSGRGALRLNTWRDMLQTYIDYSYEHVINGMAATTPEIEQSWNNELQRNRECAAVLEKQKSQLTPDDYKVLVTELEGLMVRFINSLYLTRFYQTNGEEVHRKVLSLYKKDCLRSLFPVDTVGRNVFSPAYIKGVFIKYIQLQPAFETGVYTNAGPSDVIKLINSRFTGILRDRLLMHYLQLRVGAVRVSDTLFQEIRSNTSHWAYRKIIDEYQHVYKAGKSMEHFNFIDSNGRRVQLSDFRGKVVFVDSWFNGCGACVKVARAMPPLEEKFRGQPVVFISLSIDSSRELWLSAIRPVNGKNATYFTTHDALYLNTGSIGHRHPFFRKYVPSHSFPALFLINKQGELVSANVPRPDSGDGSERLADLIKSLL